MNQSDFLIWLKGFLEAIPKGHSPNWDILKEKIETVQNYQITYPEILGVPNLPYGTFVIDCNSTNSNNSMGRTTTHIITYNQNVPSTLTGKK